MRRPYTTYFPNQLADKLRKHRVIGHYALLFGADCCLFACGPTGVGGAARAALLGRAACGPTGVAGAAGPAREARRPHFVRHRASKPARALRPLRRPPHQWGLVDWWYPARRLDARPGLASLIAGSTTNFACNSVATLSNHEVTALELQGFRAVLILRPVELPAELVEPIPTTTHTPSQRCHRFHQGAQSPGTSTSYFTIRRVE